MHDRFTKNKGWDYNGNYEHVLSLKLGVKEMKTETVSKKKSLGCYYYSINNIQVVDTALIGARVVYM